MRILIGLVPVLTALGSDAWAKPAPLTAALIPGESASILMNETGIQAIERVVRSPSSYDLAVGAHLSENQSAANSGKNFGLLREGDEGIPPADPIRRGRIGISFTALKDGSSLLMIENGYDLRFTYRARIVTNEGAEPTDVCQVVPGKRGYEHWPMVVKRIELSAMHLEAGDDTTGLRCE
jgi:hypothetical protein